MFVFVPVLEQLCTLRELEEYYSIDDLADMNEAIEVKHYLQQQSLGTADNASTPVKKIIIDGAKAG